MTDRTESTFERRARLFGATPEERTAALISDAAEAVERIDADELERFAKDRETWPLSDDYTARAYETDNGPGGVSWELHDASAGGWRGSYASLDELLANVVEGYPVAVYTLEAWYDAHDENGDAPEDLLPTRIEVGGARPAHRTEDDELLPGHAVGDACDETGAATLTVAIVLAGVLLAGYLAVHIAAALSSAARGLS